MQAIKPAAQPKGQAARIVLGVPAFIWRYLAMMVLALTLQGGLPAAVAAPVVIPDFSSWVVDTTGTLDTATKAQLEQRLAELNTTKGAQLAVLVVPTTGSEAIESYALKAFEQWRIGRKSVDDGILFLIAKDDRKLRIEVGYGLEGAVPDLLAGRIIREQVTPRFKEGDYAGGIVAGVDSLVGLINDEDLPPPASGAGSSDDDDIPWVVYAGLALFALLLPLGVSSLFIGAFLGMASGSFLIGIAAAIAAFFISLLGAVLGIRNKATFSQASGRGSSGGGFGGGFGGGGSSGGFGGGGGGSSGGGGASGSW